jgi:AmiR/NasT family two-component response regulator
MGANAIITTPIRASGLLATVVFAMQNARHNRQMAERIASLEQKVNGARHLNEAKSILMTMHQISETQAYEILRGQAMAKRVSVEDMCHSIIQAGELLKVKRVPIKPGLDDTDTER